jgi:hypothetical protein
MDFVRDGMTDSSTAMVVDPATVNTKSPTIGAKCGTPAGVAVHRSYGERSCQDCLDAANDARNDWLARQEEREDRERAARAAELRPSLAVILTAYGVRDPDAAIAAMAKHGYGDHADALLAAAKECPISTDVKATGSGVRTWLRGRANLIQRIL